MRHLLRRRPKMHPLNKAAFTLHAENDRRARAARKVKADRERNLAGVRAAKAALRARSA